ncbi:MAG: glycoside hydrolase family 16 protein [Microbacteriaceae bacterium]|nr:glycoside hydrolase family 16 protein [Microbacteriaceae bacterium]
MTIFRHGKTRRSVGLPSLKPNSARPHLARPRAQTRACAIAVAATVAIGLSFTGAVSASAASPFTATGVQAVVTGTSVTASATMYAQTSQTAASAGFCVRDAAGTNVDFARNFNVPLGPAGTPLSNTKTFTPGVYQFWACAKSGLTYTWSEVSARQSFTVFAPADNSARSPFTSSGVSATVNGWAVTASATLFASVAQNVPIAGFCVRNAAGQNVDFPRNWNVNVGPTGTPLSNTVIFPAGNYQFWACAKSGITYTWSEASARQTFTVKAPAEASTAMPVGDLPGWKQVFSDDFTTPVAAGGFPGPYAAKWLSYSGFPDTSHKGWYDQKIISAHDGVLDLFLHTENGVALGAAPLPLVNGAPYGSQNGQSYGRFSVRMKSDALPGYGLGFLLWPDSEVWNDGEIDFPEGGLDDVPHAFNHCLGNPSLNCYLASGSTSYTDWHTYTINWTPTKISFLIDGAEIGATTDNIPSKSLHWVMQVATTGVTPDPALSGHLLIDWATVYRMVP